MTYTIQMYGNDNIYTSKLARREATVKKETGVLDGQKILTIEDICIVGGRFNVNIPKNII